MDAQGYMVPAMENPSIMVDDAPAANKAPRESIFGAVCWVRLDSPNRTIARHKITSGIPHQKM
jgi:hypothetical protein